MAREFEKIFKGFDVPLPGITILLLDTSKALTHWWWAWLIAAALFVEALKKIRPDRPLLKIFYLAWMWGLVLFILAAAYGLYMPMMPLNKV